MNMLRRSTPCIAAMWCVAGLAGFVWSCGGCSQLRIDVAVYKGPLAQTRLARLHTGVGIARSVRKHAQELCQMLGDGDIDCKSNTGGTGGLHAAMKDLVCLYDSLRIDSYYEAYLGGKEPNECAAANSATKSAPMNSQRAPTEFMVRRSGDANETSAVEPLTAAIVTRPEFTRLCAALLAYSAAAETASATAGISAAARKGILPDMDFITHTIAIEESAHLLRYQIDSISGGGGVADAADDAFGRLPGIMASQSPGLQIGIWSKFPGISALVVSPDKVREVYEERYWSEINPVMVSGTGDTEYMLIKDDLGNWHLKKAVVDPSKVVNAINSGITAIVNVAATAAGVPLKLTAPAVAENSHFYEDSIDQAVADLGYDPQKEKKILAALKTQLTDAAKDKDKDGKPVPNEEAKRKMLALIDQALAQF